MVPCLLSTPFTAPPPLVASMVRCARSDCTFSICCCMRAACFMSLPMLDINLFGSVPLGSYVYDLALEHFESLFNQRVVLEIFHLHFRAVFLRNGRRRRDVPAARELRRCRR